MAKAHYIHTYNEGHVKNVMNRIEVPIAMYGANAGNIPKKRNTFVLVQSYLHPY